MSFLCQHGTDYVPKPLGIDLEGHEFVSYVPGETADYPLPNYLLKDRSIISAGQLLRRFHDDGIGFLDELHGTERWMLPNDLSKEVMCHNDFAPYNVPTIDGFAVGIIDFDSVGPGPRLWDISYAIYRWVPLYFEDDSVITKKQCLRMIQFVNGYGCYHIDYKQFIPCLVQRLSNLITYMESEAENGNKNFQDDIGAGHVTKYTYDRQRLIENRNTIEAILEENCEALVSDQ